MGISGTTAKSGKLKFVPSSRTGPFAVAALSRKFWKHTRNSIAGFYIVSSFFYKKSKQERVPTFVWLFRDDATTAKGPVCDEGTQLRLRDFVEVPLMPTREVSLYSFDPC